MLVFDFYDTDRIVGLAQGNDSAVREALASSVDRDKKIVAAAVHFQCDADVVTKDDGADVQAMRCDGRQAEGAGLWNDDRPAGTQRIAGGSGRSADNQSVRLIVGKMVAINVRPDFNE